MENKDLAKRVGLAIQIARVRSGLEQRELARFVGVTRQAVDLWERGVVVPKLASLIKVGDGLESTSPRELFDICVVRKPTTRQLEAELKRAIAANEEQKSA